MLYGYGVLFILEMLLLVYCVLSIVTTPENECRNLPKLLWLLLVVLLPLAGGIAWLVAGRPVVGGNRPPQTSYGAAPPQADPYRPRPTATAPDDDEAFLRGLRERADEQRRKAKGDGTA